MLDPFVPYEVEGDMDLRIMSYLDWICLDFNILGMTMFTVPNMHKLKSLY